MLRTIVIASSLLLMAQMPSPAPVVSVSPEEKAVILDSLVKLQDRLVAVDPLVGKQLDPSAAQRTMSVAHQVANSQGTIEPTALPFVGMALSWNSKDPKACALLQRIEPSAVCAR